MQTDEEKREKKKIAQAAWRAKNQDHIKDYNRAWNDKNPATNLSSEYHRTRYRKRREAAIAAVVAWQAANAEKDKANKAAWKLANSEKNVLYAKRWSAKNPEARRIYKQNRRARIKDMHGQLSIGLSEKLFTLQRGKCPCCKRPLGSDYHLDHKMPLALGGSNTDDNMQLLRAKCNLKKHTKHPVDFMQSRGFLL